jgi:inorganic triphosphatase YgiF
MFGQGVTLLLEVRAGLVTNPVTPPSSHRHPFSGIALFSRGEIEVRIRSLAPDLNQFDETVSARLRDIIEDRPLAPQFETRIKRRTRLLKVAASQIEVAFDEGVIVAGERSWPVTEIELEHKSGEAADLYEFGALIAKTLPAKLDVTSKSARAFALAADEIPKAVKAVPLRFPPNAMLDDAVAAVLGNALNHFVSNWAALREGGDPDSIHQMRVALRRLRAVLAMFKRALHCAEFDDFRAEAKRIASALGPARECDVFRDMVQDGPMSHFNAKANFAPLLRALEERRDDAYGDARALIDAPQTTVFVVKMHAFLARRGWRNALPAPDLARLTEPAEIFAASALERLHKRATRRGRNLVLLPDEERHEVRIVLKNLRYAAEFFGSFFANSRAVHTYIRSAARLQDLLGANNDAASAESFVDAVNDAEAARATGIVLGWYGRGGAIADESLIEAWNGFKKTKWFWR